MDDLLKCAGGGFIFPDGSTIALENIEGMRRAVTSLLGDDRDAIVRSLCGCAIEIHEAGLPGLVPEYIAGAHEAGGSPEITARALLELGAALERAKDIRMAAACYGSAIHLPERDRFDWYFLYNNLGYCLANLERFKEAVPHCLAAIRIDPSRHNAFKNLGIAFRGLGRFREAAECFRHAYLVNPEDERARQLLADLLFDGTVEDVPDLFRRRRKSRIVEQHVFEMKRTGGEMFYGTRVPFENFDGMFLALAEHYERNPDRLCIAIGMYSWVLAFEKLPVDILSTTARIIASGTPSEAADALIPLADLLSTIGKVAEAEIVFSAAESLLPAIDDFLRMGFHSHFGRFLLKRGRHSEAEPHYRECLRFDPWRSATHRGLGAVLLALGDIPAAEAEILIADALSTRVTYRIVGRAASEDVPAASV